MENRILQTRLMSLPLHSPLKIAQLDKRAFDNSLLFYEVVINKKFPNIQ